MSTLLLLEGLFGRRKRVSCEVKPESWEEIEERRIICGPRLLAAATAWDIDRCERSVAECAAGGGMWLGEACRLE